MKRFLFPLEKALEIRQLKKLFAEEKLGEAQTEESRARTRLSGAVGMRDRCFEEIRGAMGGRVRLEEMRHLLRYESSIEDEIVRQKSDLAKREASTKVAREVVAARTQEERTLDKHRENRLREYRAQFWWEEGKELDEMGSQRFIRNKGR